MLRYRFGRRQRQGIGFDVDGRRCVRLRFRRRFVLQRQLVVVGFQADHRPARFRQLAGQRLQALRQHLLRRDARLFGLQRFHGGGDRLRGRIQGGHGVFARHHLGRQGALDVGLGPAGHGGDLGHFGHREGAVHGVHRAQQCIADRQRRLLRRTQPVLQRGLVDFHLGLENLAQHAVDVGRRADGLGLGGFARFRTCSLGLENAADLVFGVGIALRRHRCRSARQRYVVGFLACTDAIGDGLHGLQVDADALAVAQRRVQLWQRRMGVVDHGQHRRRRGAAAIQHAVEHAFDLPGELAQGARADQAAAALEGVEDAADRTQPVHVVRLHAPRRQQRAEVGQLIVELFQEHLADVLVDVLGIVVKAGVEARICVGVGRIRNRRFRGCSRGHRLRIEIGSRRTQLGEELGIGFAEIDRRDGVDIDHRHGRSGRFCSRSRLFGRRQRNGWCRRLIRGRIHPGLRRRHGIGLRRHHRIVKLQRSRQPGVVIQRQRLHRMQRQDIVSVVQCVGVEAEHHVIGHRNRILFRGDRIERRCSIELGDGGQHCVGRLVAGRRIDILKHLWRLGQRPLRCTGVIAVGQFEADGIETGERRRAFVGGRERFGFGVERRQLPLRDIRRRCAGRGKD